MPQAAAPPGITAMGVFLLFGALMASLAGSSLVWPGSFLEPLWQLNPRAYGELAPFGRWIGIPFLLLAVTMACTAAGWFQRRRWAWWLVVGIITAQVLGDLVNFFLGRLAEGALGVTIAGALLYYLLRPAIRAAIS